MLYDINRMVQHDGLLPPHFIYNMLNAKDWTGDELRCVLVQIAPRQLD